MGPVDLAVHMSRGAREFFPFSALQAHGSLQSALLYKFSTLPESSDLLCFLVVFTMLWRYVAQSANEIHEAVSCLRAAFGTLSSLLGKLSIAATGLARHSAFRTLDSLLDQLSNVASGLARHSAFGQNYI